MMEGVGFFGWGEMVELTRQEGAVLYGRAGMAALAPDDEIVVVLGAFDGLHLGHRHLVSQARDDARARGVPLVVLTFDPDPAYVVDEGVGGTRLLEVRDRCRGLLHLGADYVYVISFTRELSFVEPHAFVEGVLVGSLRPVCVYCGSNFCFGRDAKGTTHTLRELGKEHGFVVRACELVEAGGDTISATRIRALLAQGGLDEANELLARSHCVRGRVVHGRGEGTALGFPTANIVCDAKDCLPQNGVYACYVGTQDSLWPAAANVGAPPSFDTGDFRVIEANLVGFTGDLYGSEVVVTFQTFLRESRPFSSLDDLRRTVLGNVEWVRQNLGEGRLAVRN